MELIAKYCQYKGRLWVIYDQIEDKLAIIDKDGVQETFVPVNQVVLHLYNHNLDPTEMRLCLLSALKIYFPD